MSTLQTTNIKNPSSTTNNIVLASDGSTTVGNLVTTQIQGGAITRGTAVASTSGTSIDFTSIPSWVKRVTVMFQGVSTNGTTNVRLQLGTSSGVTTSGYLAASSTIVAAVATVASTSGFDFWEPGSAASVRHGSVVFSLLGSNAWIANGGIIYSDSARTCTLFGSVTLSGTLDRVRITTVNGTDTFDAGSINILYEG